MAREAERSASDRKAARDSFESGVVINAAERECANRVGSTAPVSAIKAVDSTAPRKLVGRVFDRCVGRSSKRAFLQRVFELPSPAGEIPCVVNGTMAITFVTFYSDNAGVQRQTQDALAACAVPTRAS